MELALRSPVRRRRRSELSAPPLRGRLATLVEQSALELIDPDKIKALAEDMRVIERNRVHHPGLVVSSVVLSAVQRSTDTEGRWLDAQRTYEDLGLSVTFGGSVGRCERAAVECLSNRVESWR